MVLVIAVHLLILLLLLRITPPPPFRATPPKGVLLDLLPEKKASVDRSKAAKAKQENERRAARAKTPERPKPVVTVKPNAPSDAGGIWSKVIPITREDLAAADSAIRNSQGTRSAAAASEGSGEQSASVGTGPNGEPLYEADWYRRPTHAELSTYLPANAPRSGWGAIACQTAPGYRVENCSIIGQAPPGSGLGNAVLQAAWQFRVLPPRIGGRPMIGAWVRIRIDYTERGSG